MSVNVYQIKYRCYLEFSCCNFFDFDRKCDAEEFLKNHSHQWKIKTIEVLVPSK